MRPTLRAASALICFSLWLALLFLGWVLGGAVYLLLLAAFVLFPWRSLRAEEARGPGGPSDRALPAAGPPSGDSGRPA